MTAAHDDRYSYDHGPYTVADLDRKPRDARYELVNGWIVMSPWPSLLHDHVVRALRSIFERAVESAGGGFYVNGPLDVSTVSGIRVPDIGIVDGIAAREGILRNDRAHRAEDVQLVVEVVSHDSGSERTDRYEKPVEYAASRIANYWVVELEPKVNITRYKLLRAHNVYDRAERVFAGQTFKVDDPLPIEFDPAALLEF